MSKELIQQNELQQKEISTLVEAGIIPSNTPPAQIKIFARFCYEKGLSPFSGEVHLIAYNGKEGVKYSRVTGIDGYRKIAARTGELGGKDDVKYDLCADGSFKTAAELKKEKNLPISATVTVYRIKGALRVPFTATALWDEFVQIGTANGKKYYKGKWNPENGMPYHMLAKCAEAIALREGFADQLSGIHIPEEQGAWEDVDKTGIGGEESEKELLSLIVNQLQQIHTIEDLEVYFRRNPQWKADMSVIQLFSDRKEELTQDASN